MKFQTTINKKPGLILLVALLTACSSAPKLTSVPTQVMSTNLPPVTNYALSLVGAPYHFGSASINKGFDCSGFVQYVYERHGVRLPRTAREMAWALPKADNLRSGDLVFFDTNGGTFSHVGLFVKDDKFVHAPSSQTGKVLVSSLSNPYWRRHFTGVRRPYVVKHRSSHPNYGGVPVN